MGDHDPGTANYSGQIIREILKNCDVLSVFQNMISLRKRVEAFDSIAIDQSRLVQPHEVRNLVS